MRVAVLGLGSAGSRHARNLLELGHEVIGFDPVAPAPEGVTPAETQQDAIERGEAVVVATPNTLHAAQSLEALRAGRHVLVEKPLATTAGEARLVAEAAADGQIAAMAMNLRFHPALEALKTLVDGCRLGDIHLAEAVFGYDLRRWRPDTDYRESYSARADLGGGIVLDAIHELDYLQWLLGPVATVSGETARVSGLEIDVEDVALALLRFRSGALATVSLNFFEPAYRRGCFLAGSEAVARWTWDDDAIEIRGADGTVETVGAAGDVADTYVAVVHDFTEAVETGRPPRTSVAEGAEAVRVAVAVKRSAAGGVRVNF